jgi:hypothetical protein
MTILWGFVVLLLHVTDVCRHQIWLSFVLMFHLGAACLVS